jgi:hypothetical protein
MGSAPEAREQFDKSRIAQHSQAWQKSTRL